MVSMIQQLIPRNWMDQHGKRPMVQHQKRQHRRKLAAWHVDPEHRRAVRPARPVSERVYLQILSRKTQKRFA